MSAFKPIKMHCAVCSKPIMDVQSLRFPTVLRFQKLSSNAYAPTKSSIGAAGFDLYAANDEPIIIAAGGILYICKMYACMYNVYYCRKGSHSYRLDTRNPNRELR